MSLLDNPKVRRFLWLPDKHEPHTIVQPRVPTLDERLNEAAANRCYAFEIIEDACSALKDSAQIEAEVAIESLRRAERGLEAARETAARILESGRESAKRYESQAEVAEKNSIDDSTAASRLGSLIKIEKASSDA